MYALYFGVDEYTNICISKKTVAMDHKSIVIVVKKVCIHVMKQQIYFYYVMWRKTNNLIVNESFINVFLEM